MFLHFFFYCSDKTLTKPTHSAGKGWRAQLSLQLQVQHGKEVLQQELEGAGDIRLIIKSTEPWMYACYWLSLLSSLCISDLCLGNVNHPQQVDLPTSINLTKVILQEHRPTGQPNLHSPQWPPRTHPQARITSTFLSDPQEHTHRSA